MTLTTHQIKLIAAQFAAIAIKHGGVVEDAAKGAIRFPSVAAKRAFEAEYAAAPKVV